MTQYPVTPQGPGYEAERMGPVTANANPLGLSVLGFVTVLLGCYYVGFFAPTTLALTRLALGAVLTISGIVEILAGMWAFRKNTEPTAGIFTAYGGFLIIAGYLFIATGGILPVLSAAILHVVFGLLFICWFFMGAVLWLSARANSMLRITVGILVLAYLILAIGHFLFDNIIILYIGGWLAIVCGFVGWLGVAMNSLGIAKIEENLPSKSQMQQRMEATD